MLSVYNLLCLPLLFSQNRTFFFCFAKFKYLTTAKSGSGWLICTYFVSATHNLVLETGYILVKLLLFVRIALLTSMQASVRQTFINRQKLIKEMQLPVSHRHHKKLHQPSDLQTRHHVKVHEMMGLLEGHLLVGHHLWIKEHLCG